MHGLAFVQSGHSCMESSGCKPGALHKLHFDLSKRTFQYAYLVTTYLLSCVCTFINRIGHCIFILEEGDGRCVRASWPDSTKLSVLNLLLNPPSIFGFTKIFVDVLY